jgi:hypothetical protein
VHEVKVVAPSRLQTKDIADVIVEKSVAESLARINEAVAEKTDPIKDLTIHFYPDRSLVVANLEQQ